MMVLGLRVLVAGAVLTLVGCATQAAPNLIDGQYYMAGDSNCARYNRLSTSRINCADKNGNSTGYRDAMSDQELYMYQMNVAREQAQIAAMSNQLQAQNAAMAANTASTLRSISSMPTPQPASIYQPGGYQVRCITAGIYTNCRY